MRLVDAHCHLESGLYDGCRDRVVEEAERAGLAAIITSSITPSQWEFTLELARRYRILYASLGIHPWYIEDGDLERVTGLTGAAKSGAVAIGEIGLDRKVDSPPFETQRAVFEAQLSLAREINLPVIIHCRGAFNELVESLKRLGTPESGGIVHSFSGNAEIARSLAKYNLSFSLGGILTYRNSRKRSEMLKSIYPDRFLLETDSPDIPPVEAKDTLHTPANILYNLKAASEILGESEEKIAQTTTHNAIRIFKLHL